MANQSRWVLRERCTANEGTGRASMAVTSCRRKTRNGKVDGTARKGDGWQHSMKYCEEWERNGKKCGKPVGNQL